MVESVEALALIKSYFAFISHNYRWTVGIDVNLNPIYGIVFGMQRVMRSKR